MFSRNSSCMEVYNSHIPDLLNDGLIDMLSHDPSNNCKSAQMVYAAVRFNELHLGQLFILLLNQMFHVNGLRKNLVCPMQFHLNSVSINEVPKFCDDI